LEGVRPLRASAFILRLFFWTDISVSGKTRFEGNQQIAGHEFWGKPTPRVRACRRIREDSGTAKQKGQRKEIKS